MAIPTVTEVEEFKEDLDDAEALVNGFGQVQTRLGGLKDSYSLLVSRIAHGDITAYSALATYTDITDWVTESGIVYRPDPAQLPIGPEAFDANKWFVAQGYTQADGLVAPVETYAAALALPTSLPLGAIVPIYGDGIAGNFVVTTGAISASSTGVQLSNATWNAAGKHLEIAKKYILSDEVQTQSLSGYFLGSAVLKFNASRARGDHDGLSVISTTAVWDGAASNFLDFATGASDTDPSGDGCYELISDDKHIFPVKYRAGNIIEAPTGFPARALGSPYHPYMYIDSGGVYRCKIDLLAIDRARKNPTHVEYYVDVNNGDNANDGLTSATAKKSIGGGSGVIAKINSDAPSDAVLYVKSGFYDYINSWLGQVCTVNLSVICEEGTWLSTSYDPSARTWTDDGSNTYVNTQAGVAANTYAVVDFGSKNHLSLPTRYTEVGSEAECKSTTSSFYNDGTNLYVHTHNNREPDNDIWLLRASTNGKSGLTRTSLRVKNAKFVGGTRPFYHDHLTGGSGAPTLIFEDCLFGYSEENGFLARSAQYIFFKNCVSVQNGKDGFGYYDPLEVTTRFLEIDCVHYDNGKIDDGSTNNNGSTSHDAVVGYRVNTFSYQSVGPCFADVGQAKTWNLGCGAYSSSSTLDNNNCGWQTQPDGLGSAGDATQWLDGCDTVDCTYDLYTRENCAIYIRNYKGGLSIGSSSETIEPY